MMDIMPFDEMNALKERLPAHFENGRIRSEQDKEDIIDEMLDLFLLACANGVELTNADLGGDYAPGMATVSEIVDREIAGQTWRERVNDYYANGGTIGDIERIIETETHRDANEAAFITARANGATKKTWHCMMINSRDSHVFLDGVSAPIDGYFYSINGGSTLFPGEWGIADEDVNCRCWLSYEK